MMERKTSVSDGYNEFRGRVSLQFFAEGDTGADMDGFDFDGFEAAFEGDAGDQRGGEEGGNEDGANDAGDQRGGGQNEDPEDEPPNGGGQEADPPEEGGQADKPPEGEKPEAVTLKVMDSVYTLPAEAVRELQSALGADPISLIQKGMNYDHKAERELRILNKFAEAEGMNLAQYVEGLEQHLSAESLNRELEKVKAEYPGTPEEAARAIAQQRVDAAKAADRQREAEQAQAVQQSKARVEQMVAEARRQAEIKAWDEYEKALDIHKPEDVPPRVMELVQKEGLSPIAAHYKYQAEQAESKLKIETKTKQNAGQSVGSMAGADGDTSDPFLRGFLGL